MSDEEWFNKQDIDAIMADDRAYFAQHPKRRFRLREPHRDEVPPGITPRGTRPAILIKHLPIPGSDDGHGVRGRACIDLPIDTPLDSFSQFGLERLWLKLVPDKFQKAVSEDFLTAAMKGYKP